MDDVISRQQAIDELVKMLSYCFYADEEVLDKVETTLKELPSVQLGTNLAEVGTKIEPLTDKEQRIFLAAMGRERKVCKEVDDQYTHEPYEVLLTKVCSEIERKVKAALWS